MIVRYSALFITIFLPGMIYYWITKGTRGIDPWHFFIDSFRMGLAVNSLSFLIFLFLGEFSPSYNATGVLDGWVSLLAGTFKNYLASSEGVNIALFYVFCYIGCIFFGFGLNWLVSSRVPKRLSLEQKSALDVEMHRLRDFEIAPKLTVYMKNGTHFEGKCRTYTFTNPREIMLERPDTKEEGQITRLIWIQLDDNVERIEIVFDNNDGRGFRNSILAYHMKKAYHLINGVF